MSKTISGILLKAEDGSEPMPIPVGDHTTIQQYVGGWFDCVQATYKASQFLLETGDEFVAIGYVHDEGIILGLPLNKMATLMFRRELYGDVVVVSGTSPKGEYDGDNYDVPSWFSDHVFGGALAEATQELDDKASFMRDALLRSVKEGLLDKQTASDLVTAMSEAPSLDEDETRVIQEILDMVTKYHVARIMGMPRFSDDLLSRIDELTDMMEASDKWEVTDEAIAQFLAENGGE
jgi:hypothetical protein